jgi:hypothetical protein
MKYEALARRLGVEALLKLVPADADRVRAALEAGDEHLNGIPLVMWDRAALGAPETLAERTCPTCKHVRPSDDGAGLGPWSSDWPQTALKRTARLEPWRAAPGLSLAERVCVLKHVAKFHLAATERREAP